MATTDRDRLVALRVSVARAAQVYGVELPYLRVLGRPYEELVQLARSEERGWNALVAAVMSAEN